MPHNPSDPRTIITPDAFEVDRGLLGLPLAAPSRRGVASLIDLVLIGVITGITRDIGAVVGVLVAVVFVTMALRSPITRDLPTPLAWAFRVSVGCLGFVILLISVSAIWWLTSGPDLDDLVSLDEAVVGVEGSGVTLGDVLSGLQGGVDLTRATSADEAQVAADEIARTGFDAGLEEDEVRGILEQFLPEDASWEDEADEILDRAIRAGRGAASGGEGPAGESIDDLPPEQALIEYARVLQADTPAGEIDDEQVSALRERAFLAVGSDTLRRLESRLRDLESDNARRERALEEARSQVEALEEGSGLVRLIRELVDRLGLAFGWGSIYFAVLLPWWKGQTVGKKLLGVRVLRLDGEPITWWLAFERAGGYAAGVATGLLGFAQVYWDPNRQGIHDKIAGTVVIRDGAPRAPGAWTGGGTTGSATGPPPGPTGN